MPEISRFYGIVAYMFFNDHNPPYFKVKYSEFEANVLIDNGSIMNGDLSISKLKQVQALAEIHKEELMDMWLSKQFHKVNSLDFASNFPTNISVGIYHSFADIKAQFTFSIYPKCISFNCFVLNCRLQH